MALLQRCPDMIEVGDEPVISVAQQMAFYFSVSEDEIRFDDYASDNSCTIQVNGEYFDVFFDPITSMVIDWFPA